MLANANYALEEKLQLGHMLKPFAAATSPPVSQPPLVLWKITTIMCPPVCVCVGACTFDLEESWFRGSGLGI